MNSHLWLLLLVLPRLGQSWTSSHPSKFSHVPPVLASNQYDNNNRRAWLQRATSICVSPFLLPTRTLAATTAASPEITDKLYISLKGLPGSTDDDGKRRIVMGLYGTAAPKSVQQLKSLLSRQGLNVPCRPRAERTLQKEQLEANKVYSACMESAAETGVSLLYSTLWRIVRDERIDVGAVSGRFVAREYPDWPASEKANVALLRHNRPGVVSVRTGNQGGFGFTIYPGNNNNNNGGNTAAAAAAELDEDHIIIGQVLEGMDVVEQLNRDVPVVASSKKLNYMQLTGGPKTNNAPDRSCRYGGPMYCNENKPLVKISIVDAGVL